MRQATRLCGIICATAALFAPFAFPQTADELFRQGARQFAEGHPDAAISALRRAVQLQPEYAAAWKALGVVFASKGDFESAETPFRNACERQPSLPEACLYYGRTLYLLNHFQPAVDVLRRTLAGERNQAEAHRLLALSLEGMGQTAEADAEFRQAMQLNRGGVPDEDPGIDYAVFLFRQGRGDEALAPVEAVLKRHPDTARAHLELGCILLSLDRLNEAASHLERAVTLDPGKPRGHQLLAKVYLRLGKTEAAEEQLRQGSRTAR